MAVQSGDVLRIVAKMSWGDADIQNVYHCQTSGSDFGTNLDVLGDIADDIEAVYQVVDQDMPNTITFDTIEGYNVTREEYLGEIGWPQLTNAAGGADAMPPQCAPLVLFNTTVPRSQGRKFFPPLTEVNNDTDGTPTVTLLTNLATMAALLLAGVTEGTWSASFGNYRELGEVFIPWIGAQVKDFFATQRRRYLQSGS